MFTVFDKKRTNFFELVWLHFAFSDSAGKGIFTLVALIGFHSALELLDN